MKIKKKEIVAIVIVIPIFTVLSHLFGYWIWGILLIAPIVMGLFFYFESLRFEGEIKKIRANRKIKIQEKWDKRNKLKH